MEMIKNYIGFCYHTIYQYIMTSPILELCCGEGLGAGEQVPKQWWEQRGVDWQGVQDAARAEEAEGMEIENIG